MCSSIELELENIGYSVISKKKLTDSADTILKN